MREYNAACKKIREVESRPKVIRQLESSFCQLHMVGQVEKMSWWANFRIFV
jgi:hypothetical protein